MVVRFLAALSGCALALAQSAAVSLGPATMVHVVNAAPATRTGMVLMSVPFARGELPCTAATAREPVLAVQWSCGGEVETVPAVPLLRWCDGTIAVLQVHARVHVPAGAEVRGSVRPCLDADGAALPRRTGDRPSLLPPTLPVWTEVEDPWGRVAVARLEPDPTAGPDGVLLDSGAVRVQRFRSRHRLADGAPFLGLRAWLRSYAGERRGELTLLLDDTDATAPGLGPVRFRSFRLVVADDRLRTLPLFAEQNGLQPPRPRHEGGYVQPLMGPAESLYLGDQTGKAFRLMLFADGDDVQDEERLSARWSGLPLMAFADLDRVRATGAFGAHGGPAPSRDGERDGARAQWWRWRQGGDFGLFGGFGEPIADADTGVARNGDSALHNVLRWRSPQLAMAAEAMVLQHTLRPTPGRRPALPADMAPYRLGITPPGLRAPHGFQAPDYEHFSVLLLYDWYWLTGDPLARDEMARLGRGLQDLLAALPFRTSRGEGCCLQAGALIARATADPALTAWLLQRCKQQLLPRLPDAGTGCCIAQPPLPQVLGDQPFDAPWQMACLVRGLHALYIATGDAALAAAVVRSADAMAGAGWLDGHGPKYFVSALDPGRYTMPADASIEAGVARIVLGAFAVARELAVARSDAAAAQRLDNRIGWLFERLLPAAVDPAELAALTANPWLQIALDRRARPEDKR